MAKIDKLSSTKRFGHRYGRKLKQRFDKIEREQRRLHKCPYCHYQKVRRVAIGIWHCNKCDAKFAGKAYTIGKKIITKEEKPEVDSKSAKIEKVEPKIESTVDENKTETDPKSIETTEEKQESEDIKEEAIMPQQEE